MNMFPSSNTNSSCSMRSDPPAARTSLGLGRVGNGQLKSHGFTEVLYIHFRWLALGFLNHPLVTFWSPKPEVWKMSFRRSFVFFGGRSQPCIFQGCSLDLTPRAPNDKMLTSKKKQIFVACWGAMCMMYLSFKSPLKNFPSKSVLNST